MLNTCDISTKTINALLPPWYAGLRMCPKLHPEDCEMLFKGLSQTDLGGLTTIIGVNEVEQCDCILQYFVHFLTI